MKHARIRYENQVHDVTVEADNAVRLADVVPGDEVVVEVEGVGRLINRIVSEREFFAARG